MKNQFCVFLGLIVMGGAKRVWTKETYREDGLTSEGGYFESEDVRRAHDYADLRKR
ncbi:MAG: hypothetical protein LBT00_02375 [Spirochaetaceae bacterium]|jgi:hypothetical protein|nr:hypothetical protein [Spirochaetaceae bacterium]